MNIIKAITYNIIIKLQHKGKDTSKEIIDAIALMGLEQVISEMCYDGD